MKKLLFILLFALGASYWGWGQLLVEDFDYPSGDNITSHGWTAHSGGGTQPITVNIGGLTYSGYVSSGVGNAALVDNTGEDDNKSFSVQSAGSVYVSFMVNVTTVAAGYFFHLGPSPIGTTFRGKVFMDATNHFGVSVGSNTGTYASSTFSTGTTYLLVLKYEIVSGTSNNIVSLYIFDTTCPYAEPGTPTIGPLTDAVQSDINPGTVALRQHTATQNIIVDGVRIGSSWSEILPEPGGTPTHLAVSSVNGGSSPVSGVPFSVTVQSQDDSNAPQNVTSDVNITLSGTGIGGTTTGTILNGESSVTVTGVTMSEGYGLTITATQTSGTPTLTDGISSSFYVMSTTPSYRTKASGNWSVAGTWEIQISGNWYDAAEYPDGSNKNATVLNGHTVTITDNNGKFNNLTVDNGGKVWVGTTTARFIYAYGNITCDGTIGDAGGTDGLGFDIEGSSCTITGSGLFKISRIAKYTNYNTTTNLSLDMNVSIMYSGSSTPPLYNFNPNDWIFNITIDEGKQLSVPNDTINLSGCTLTLKNNASLIDIGAINGQSGTNVTVERSFSGNDPDYHLFSPPIATATANTFLSMYLMSFDPLPSVPYGLANDYGYTDIIDPATALGVMEGYALYSDLAANAVSFTGNLNIGNQSHSFNLNGNNPDGWNLLGNPYPSAIDWDLVTIPSEMNGEVHYIEAATGADISYVLGGGGGGRYVPPMQGFFVSAISAGSLQLSNTVRTHTGAGSYYKSEVNDLLVLEASGNGFTNETRIYFNEEATHEHDRLFDAYKIITSSNPQLPQLFSITPVGIKLSINGTPETNLVPLGMIAGVPGEYSISAIETSEFENVVLEDLVEGIKIDLLQESYTFNYGLNEPESRFIVHFTPMAVPKNFASLINIYSNNHDVYVASPANTKGTVRVFNLMGQEVANAAISEVITRITLDKSAYYVVEVVSDASVVTKKVFVK